MSTWGYNEDNGPSLWSKWYPVADLGDRQSPIDIITGSATLDPALAALKYAYDPAAIRLVNTGATWRMDFEPEGSNLSGGPLEGSYKVLQMHAHWGDKAGRGSEHTLDGKEFDAELHIVHWNEKYGDPSVAVDKPDGLAVLGMFLKTGTAHPEMEKICSKLGEILTKDKKVEMAETLDPTNFLPANKTFYTYPGSLTTPPLFESVTWIVFGEVVEVSEAQLDAMRAMKVEENDDCPCCIVNNYRPPCKLGERKVRVKKA